ncbi:hypothetical protein A3749_10885, partial [Oleiphilus sp. HI0078]
YENLFHNANELGLPSFQCDPIWPSPCAVSIVKDCHYWRHKEKRSGNIFASLEDALETKFHPDFHAFFESYWANGMRVEHPLVDFALIQTWNEEDQERLKENILGHCFAKLKNKQSLTLFIGCTDSNEVVSIENHSGKVILERPGRKDYKELADNLESFLLALNPTALEYN